MNNDLIDTVFNYPSELEPICIEFGHSMFNQTYRFTPNCGFGITVKHEDQQNYEYRYLQCSVGLGNTTDELEQTINVTLGGMGDELEADLDAILGMSERPFLNYRRYRKGLLQRPIVSITNLICIDCAETKGKVSFKFSTPKLNQLATADKYSFEKYRDLRSFVT